MPDGSRTRSTRTSGHQPTSLPSARARKPEASRASSDTKASATKPTAKSDADLVEEGARDAFDVGGARELAGDPAQALELPLALRRDRAAGGRRAAATATTKPTDAGRARARRATTATLSHASARPLRPTGSDSIEVMLGVADSTERTALPSECFQAAERDPSAFKRWAVRPIVGLRRRGIASLATGRCEPRRAYLALQSAVSNLREARRTDPPERRAFSFPRPYHAVFIRPGLSWPAVW